MTDFLDARIELRQRFVAIPEDGKGIVESGGDPVWQTLYRETQETVLESEEGTQVNYTSYVLGEYVRVALTLARHLGLDLSSEDGVRKELAALSMRREWKGQPVFPLLPTDPALPGAK
jgi:hypothetical protein